jgi:hypothetical protein
MARTLFTTKCWQKDYLKYLKGEFDRKTPSFPFDEKILFLNNGVPSLPFPCKTVDVIPLIDEVLEFFDLKDSDFQGGFWYSIEELTELYVAKDFDYICHYASDCSGGGQWVHDALTVLELEKDVSVVSPRSEVNTWHDRAGYDQFFSDQCYLIRVNEFRQRIYDYPGTIPDYPEHGGNSFEHRVAKYLRANNKYRKILDAYWYDHN